MKKSGHLVANKLYRFKPAKDNTGQQNQLFSSVKAVLTVFGLVWDADSKSVLIFFFVARKILKLWNYIYYKYLYC